MVNDTACKIGFSQKGANEVAADESSPTGYKDILKISHSICIPFFFISGIMGRRE
jgi:hypothetical protein